MSQSSLSPRSHLILNIMGLLMGFYLIIFSFFYVRDFYQATPVTGTVTDISYQRDMRQFDTVDIFFTYTDAAEKEMQGEVALMKMALDKRILTDNKLQLRQTSDGKFYPDSFREIRCLLIATIIWWAVMLISVRNRRLRNWGKI